MAFRQRFETDINSAISSIIRSEFPGIPLYQGNYNSHKSMFFKINKISDSLIESRNQSTQRSYSINLKFFVKNFLSMKRSKGLDLAYRNSERLRQLLFSYKNQLLVDLDFNTVNNETFFLSNGDSFSVPKNDDVDTYNYHNLNVSNVNLSVEQDKGYFVFDFNIEANIEKIFNS